MLSNQTVTVTVHGRDDFQRELAIVRVGDRDIGLEMIEQGHVWFDGDERTGSSTNYADAQDSARRRRVGLWQREAPIPPWDFDPPNLSNHND
jgi:endonuclease YncB( thermonuclease family)